MLKKSVRGKFWGRTSLNVQHDRSNYSEAFSFFNEVKTLKFVEALHQNAALKHIFDRK